MSDNTRAILYIVLVVSVGLAIAILQRDDLTEESAPAPGHASEPSLPDGWITVPERFEQVATRGRPANGTTQGMPILDGRYQVSIGTFEFNTPNDGSPDYYSISIERAFERGSMVVSDLSFPLAFVSKQKLQASPQDVVSADPETLVVTFDLGKGVFKYQLPSE